MFHVLLFMLFFLNYYILIIIFYGLTPHSIRKKIKWGRDGGRVSAPHFIYLTTHIIHFIYIFYIYAYISLIYIFKLVQVVNFNTIYIFLSHLLPKNICPENRIWDGKHLTYYNWRSQHCASFNDQVKMQVKLL